ncbi:MAG: hypothetical protein LBI69_03170 [Puniceicoccales bacterium]|nr:hypothetical protein [Puniceicoccales bacterium]
MDSINSTKPLKNPLRYLTSQDRDVLRKIEHVCDLNSFLEIYISVDKCLEITYLDYEENQEVQRQILCKNYSSTVALICHFLRNCMKLKSLCYQGELYNPNRLCIDVLPMSLTDIFISSKSLKINSDAFLGMPSIVSLQLQFVGVIGCIQFVPLLLEKLMIVSSCWNDPNIWIDAAVIWDAIRLKELFLNRVQICGVIFQLSPLLINLYIASQNAILKSKAFDGLRFIQSMTIKNAKVDGVISALPRSLSECYIDSKDVKMQSSALKCLKFCTSLTLIGVNLIGNIRELPPMITKVTMQCIVSLSLFAIGNCHTLSLGACVTIEDDTKLLIEKNEKFLAAICKLENFSLFFVGGKYHVAEKKTAQLKNLEALSLDSPDIGVAFVEQIVENATNLKSIIFAGDKWTYFPEWISELPAVECIDISTTKIQKCFSSPIPKSLWKLMLPLEGADGFLRQVNIPHGKYIASCQRVERGIMVIILNGSIDSDNDEESSW